MWQADFLFTLLGNSEGPQGLDTLLDTLEAIAGTFVLDGNIAIVAGTAQDGDALLNGNIALAAGTPLPLVASASLEALGIFRAEGMLDEVLGMNVEGVGCYAGNGHGAILIDACEVTHIHKQTVVVMRDGIDQSLNTVAILGNIAVVLGTGADTQLLTVCGDGTDILDQRGEHTIKATGVAGRTQTIANVMSHDLGTQQRCDVQLTAQTVDLLLGGYTLAEKVGADGVGVDVHTATVCLGAELDGIFLLLLQRRLLAVHGSQIDKLNGIQTHLLGGGNGVKLGHFPCLDGLLEGVRANGKLHLYNHSFLIVAFVTVSVFRNDGV